MEDKIFDIENGKIVINQHCLLIPWLKAIIDEYKEPINALCYVKYYSDIVGPYSDFGDDIKKEELLKDFPGEYSPEDLVIIEAIDKLQERWKYETTLRHFSSVRRLVNKFSDYADSVILDDGKDTNNIASAQRIVKDCLKTVKDFRSIEKVVQEDILKTRGNKEVAYDLK